MTYEVRPTIRQLASIRERVKQFPIMDVVDPTTYPNKLQQQALLDRVDHDLMMAQWALEEYMGKGNQ